MKKKDYILAAAILVLAFGAWLAGQFLQTGNVRTIRITVDGEIYGEYALDQDRTIDIRLPDRELPANVVEISGGKARVIQADCPDRLCQHQKPIDGTGGTIVCLPNRVVIEGVRLPGSSGRDGVDEVAG